MTQTSEVAEPAGRARDALYVRAATGLVREVSTVDQTIFNIMLLNLGLAGVYLFEFGPWARPQGNLFLILLIAGLGFAAVAATYSMLVSAFPRTGGDYVFNSRILGGFPGFWASWITFVVFATIGGASVAWFFAHSGIPFALALVARVADSATLADWAAASANDTWTTITASLLIAASAVVLISGLHIYMRIQRVLFGIGVLGIVAVVVLLATTSTDEFARSFDQVYGANAYRDVLATAKDAGIEGGWTWGATLALFPIVAVPALFAVATNWFAGELQSARQTRRVRRTMVGAVAAFVIFMVLLTALLHGTVGDKFLDAVNFQYFSGAKGYKLASDPNYFALASLGTDSAVVLGLLGLSWICWAAAWTPGNMLPAVRLLFAWSFDRLAPARVATVHRRTHTPVLATLLVAGTMEAFLLWAQFGDLLRFFVAASFMINVGMTVTCIAGMLFPFVRREMWKRSPVNQVWAGVPAITVVGFIATATMVITDIEFLVVKELFVWDRATLIYAGASAAVGVVLYFAARAIRAREGIDTRLSFAEIPPE